MSLESKIEELIKALNANTEALTAAKQSTPSAEPEKKTPAKKEVVKEVVKEETKSEPAPEPEAEQESVTYKQVQDAVLAFVREDSTKHKPLVRTLLDGFNAKKVCDLDENRLGIFMKQLGQLK